MKKSGYILLPFLVLSSALISGCGKDPVSEPKVALSYGDINSQKVTDIAGVDLFAKITDEKENLMMVISSNGCTCWQEFEPIINKYIKDNKYICYHAKYDEFIDFASNVGLTLSKSTTTFAVYENGQLKFNIHTDPENKTMSDYETFKKTLDNTVSKPRCYYVSESDVDNMMKSDKNEVIYFERSACPDCTYINKTILKDYLTANPNMNNLYILDCQPWKQLETEQYQAKKDNYGLSSKYNTEFGFNTGSFPFFSYIENGKYTSGAEAFNQTLSKVDGTVKVTDSYYTQERLPKLKYLEGATGFETVLNGHVIEEGKYSSVEYGGTTYYTWDKIDAKEYYKPLIHAFLNYTLPKVTYNF